MGPIASAIVKFRSIAIQEILYVQREQALINISALVTSNKNFFFLWNIVNNKSFLKIKMLYIHTFFKTRYIHAIVLQNDTNWR